MSGLGLLTGNKTEGAHRVAYRVGTGLLIPKRMVIRHTCDTRACINPAHLLLGTYKNNTQDMISRGRAPWQGDKWPAYWPDKPAASQASEGSGEALGSL